MNLQLYKTTVLLRLKLVSYFYSSARAQVHDYAIGIHLLLVC